MHSLPLKRSVDFFKLLPLTGGGGDSEVVARGQLDPLHPEALLPGPPVAQVVRDGEDVPLVADGHVGVVLQVAELDLAAAHHGVGAVAVVVVVQAAVVHHGGEVGVLVLEKTGRNKYQ